MSYAEYSNQMSYEEYQAMNDDANQTIIDAAWSLYCNLGCWMYRMVPVPPNGIHILIHCCALDVNHPTDDDNLRADMAKQLVQYKFGEKLESIRVTTEVVYTSHMIDRSSILKGIEAMLPA